MLRLKSYLLILFLLMSSLFRSNAAGDKSDMPDFAYPQTVITDAEKSLSTATNGADRLRAVLEICAAREMIDPDTIFSLPAFVREQMMTAGLSDADRAMFTSYEAQLYRNIYGNNRFKYDRVDAPLEPFPADINLWSGKQFRKKISELYIEAAAYAAKDNPALSAYKRCLEYNDNALRYICDVRGFVAYRAYNWYDDGQTNDARLSTAKDAAGFYAAGTAPWFFWETRIDDSRKALFKLYDSYKDNEAARYILLRLCQAPKYAVEREYDEDGEDLERVFNRRLTADLEQSLKQFPDWFGNAALSDKLAMLTRPVLTVTGNSKCAPNSEYELTVKASFVKDYSLTLYSLPAGNIVSTSKLGRIGRKISTIKNSIKSADDTTFTVSVKVGGPGKYAILPDIVGEKNDEASPVYFEVVPFLPIAVTGLEDKGVILADFTTGAPVSAAVNLNLYNWRRSNEKKTKYLGTTSREGVLMFKAEDGNLWQSQTLSFRYRNRNYDFGNEISVGNNWRGDVESESARILIFTDRPIYHPGDTIEWAAVVAKDGQVLEGKTLNVSIRNANGQKAGTATAVTDAFGRASGKFATEKGVLTGNWTLIVEADKSRNSANVMVSDFRLPTFYAEVTNVERDVPAKGAVRLTGFAKTYSGMPVADAEVKIRVMGATRWRWFVSNQEVTTLDVRTDAEGTFTADIPADKLAQPLNDGKPYMDFKAEIDVTSPDGATTYANRSFTTGKPYVLEASAPETTVDNSTPVPVTFKAYDANGKEATIAVKWSLRDDEDTDEEALLSGTANTGKTENLNLSSLGAGDYYITVEPVDTALAKATEPFELTLYNVEKGLIPAYEKIFVPVRTIEAQDGKAEVLVGVDVDKAYVYTIVRHGKNLEKIRLHTLAKGYNRIPVESGNPEEAQVKLAWVLDGNPWTADITVKVLEKRQPEVKAESFRDHLVPGATETWRFRLLDGEGKPMENAAMIATLFNRALEELAKQSLPVNFGFYKPQYSFWLDRVFNFRPTGSVRKALSTKNTRDTLIYPNFLFSNNWMLRESVMIRGMNYKMAATARAPMADSFVGMDITEGEVAEEVEDLASNVTEAAVATGGDAGTPQQEQFEYRTGEALQGFWRPSLVADKDGNIDITFTVPNANGSWRLNGFAWTKNTEAARYIAECIANKPVMVQPNLPRFLRQGDKARVLATVYNNSDSEAEVTSVIEIFDIATGHVVSTSTSTDKLAAKGSAVVGIDVTAPVDASSIGYRVRSTAGQFADGEQTMIPVLPSSTVVIESTEFYLNPNQSEPYTFTVKNQKDASLTLQYCQNPVWTAVKAMRGIAGEQANTSSALASKIFSALAAKKIIGDNNEIADAIRNWRNNPSEKALTSMLEKNETLKRLLLDQTPWVQAAKNETQRMTALCQVLDPALTEAALKTSTAALKKLQNADGGFAWASWAEESSIWSTETVLMTLGIANSLGMLPGSGNLRSMLQPAFNYLVTEALKPDMPATDTNLALISVMLPQLDTRRADALIKRTLDAAAAGWKKGNVINKAWDILLLAKAQPETAKEILASIRQFGVVRPGQGLCFPSISDIRGYATIIQAYATMDASKKEIDAMRQWVLVQGQANDDFGAYNPDYVVAALMLTGSCWTSVPVSQNVTVNGEPLEIGSVESATGYFAESISAGGKNVTISVKPNGVTPSYGSVISISREPMSKVKARPGRDLSIEKRVLVQREGKWVETSSFTLGERVRVQLTIVAKRNLEYVSIDDERPATFEPVDQLPGFVWDGGTGFYRENLDASTRIFISWLAKGTYHLTYDMTANVAGDFISGIATLQSQLAPELTAHSSAAAITVR